MGRFKKCWFLYRSQNLAAGRIKLSECECEKGKSESQ